MLCVCMYVYVYYVCTCDCIYTCVYTISTVLSKGALTTQQVKGTSTEENSSQEK